MNATAQARTTYGAQAGPTRSPRAIEYDSIARITRGLKTAAEKPAGMAALAAAIHDNRRLWTVLAADVATESNPLPRELRARILYLAEFTRVHSSKVLRNGASVQPLVEVNTAVMRGLAERGAAQ